MTERPVGKVNFGAKEWAAMLTPTLLLIGAAIHWNVRMSLVESALYELKSSVNRFDNQRETTARNEQKLDELQRRVDSWQGHQK